MGRSSDLQSRCPLKSVNRDKYVRQGLILKLFLLVLFSGVFGYSALAQTGSTDNTRPQLSSAPQQGGTGIQISNQGPTGNSPISMDQGQMDAERDRRRAQEQELQLRRLPPEPDIEFQDFVSSTLGYKLPIYGQNLFHNMPSTFAPLEHVPVTPDHLIGPGDELLILGDRSTSFSDHSGPHRLHLPSESWQYKRCRRSLQSDQ